MPAPTHTRNNTCLAPVGSAGVLPPQQDRPATGLRGLPVLVAGFLLSLTAAAAEPVNVRISIQPSEDGGYYTAFREGVAPPPPEPDQWAIKWNPGHYMLTDPNRPISEQLGHIGQLSSGATGVKGVQVRIWWGEIETAQGVYDFSCINQFLSAAKAAGKQLVVQLMDRKFGSLNTNVRAGCTGRAYPQYMIDAGKVIVTQEGATSGFANKGSIAKVWESGVMDRYIALAKAVLAQYEAEDAFEMLATEETSPGLSGGAIPAGSGFTNAAYGTQLKRMIVELAAVRERTGLLIYTNSLSGQLASIMETAYQNGWAVGGPDVIPDDPVPGDNLLVGNLESPDYTCCGLRDYRGLTTVAYAVQTPARGGKEGYFGPDEITDHAVGTLKANYLFWTRIAWQVCPTSDLSGPSCAPVVNQWAETDLPYINANPNLIAACPTNLACGGSGATGAVSVAGIANNRIYQRNGTSYNLPISGTYTGAASNVQARVMSGSTEVVGWTTVATGLSGGTWSGSITVPQGGMYTLDVRLRTAGGTVLSSVTAAGSFGVGALFGVIGSSSPQRWFSIGTGTPNALCRKFNEDGWATLGSSGVASINFCNRVVADLGIPVGLLDYGVSGSRLSEWQNTANANWLAFSSGVQAVGGKLEGVIQAVGYNDATGNVSSRASHTSNLGVLASNVRSLTSQPSLPVYVIQSQRRVGGSDTQFNRLRPAEYDFTQTPNVYLAATSIDLALISDGIHPDASGYAMQGARVGEVVSHKMGGATCSRGPRITGITAVSATVTDVTITHSCGEDFTPTSGITGFVVLDGGTSKAISGAVRQNATTIRLTHASVSGSRSVQYQVGANPSVSGAVKDDSALALPLEFTPDAVTP